jgi:hypothetical protein
VADKIRVWCTCCAGQDRTLSLDGHLNGSKTTLYGSPWGTNGPPSTTSEEKQLLQLDLNNNNNNNSHDHHHKLQHPRFYPVTPTMLCFLLCTTRFHATSIVSGLYNDDATGPSTAPDCLPRDSGIGDHIHKQSTQDTTFFMPITMRLHWMTTTTSLGMQVDLIDMGHPTSSLRPATSSAEDDIIDGRRYNWDKNDYQRWPILE